MQQRWQDWTGLVLGFLLVLSPYVLGFWETATAAPSALLIGLATMALFAIALVKPGYQWSEWVNLGLAAVLVIAPFAMGFTAILNAAYTHWFLGALIGLDAIWALYELRGKSPATA